jgi:hypothetical protein
MQLSSFRRLLMELKRGSLSRCWACCSLIALKLRLVLVEFAAAAWNCWDCSKYVVRGSDCSLDQKCSPLTNVEELEIINIAAKLRMQNLKENNNLVSIRSPTAEACSLQSFAMMLQTMLLIPADQNWRIFKSSCLSNQEFLFRTIATTTLRSVSPV